MVKKNAAQTAMAAAEKEEAKMKAAAEGAAKRSKGKKGKGMMTTYVAIGVVVGVTLLGVLGSMGGSSRRKGSSVSASSSVHDISFANENFSTSASSFFNRWTLDDVKYGLGGTVLRSENFVGMAGTIERCDEEEGMEGGVLPTSYDVRDAWPNCAGKVYNSGNCSSSYAIAAASSLSSRFCIADVAKYSNLQLSPQQIVSCDKKSQGCQGGGADSVWGYIKRRGLYPEECVPFAGATKAQCKTDCKEDRKLKALSHCLKSGEKEIKREIYNRGPIVAPIYVKDDFLVYGKGVYSPSDEAVQQFSAAGEPVLQAVTVLGWGRDQGIKYWVVANSWGTDWGEDGYARVAIDTVLRESYGLVGYPATEEAIKAAAEKKEKEALAKEEAKKERAARDERIREKQRQRAEEQQAAQDAADDEDFESDDEVDDEVELDA